jgi:hypothetical protein
MDKQKSANRNVFTELMEGIDAMKAYREGGLTLRTHKLSAPNLLDALPSGPPTSATDQNRNA